MPVDHTRLYELILPRLQHVSGRATGPDRPYPDGRGFTWARCPVPGHNDMSKRGNRSLHLSPSMGVNCFAGCTYEAILESVGIDPKTQFSEDPAPNNVRPFRRTKPPEGEPGNTPPQAKQAASAGRHDGYGQLRSVYEYRSSKDGSIYQKGRFENAEGAKTFKWRRHGDGPGWPGIKELYGVEMWDLELYGSDAVKKAPVDQPVFFVEGEKAADACIARQLLAVTTPGGASVKTFGDQFELLRGRIVYVWPDNDSIGYEFMRYVVRTLRGVAAKIIYVRVPLPEKGDAADYFEGDPEVGRAPGDVETIFREAPSKPVLEFLDDDRMRVVMPSQSDAASPTPVSLLFSDIERERRSLRAEISVSLIGQGTIEVPFSSHVDMLSVSNMEAFRRALDKAFGDNFGWTKILNIACNRVIDGWRNQDRSIDTADIPPAGNMRYHVADIIPLGEPTVVFGAMSSTKSYQVFHMAACISLGIPWCGREVVQCPVMIIDWESDTENYGRRMRRVAQGLGMDSIPPYLVRYWPARGIPLAEQTDAIRRVIEKYGIGMIIIDSAVPACGMEAEKSSVAAAYFNALRSLGRHVTSITLAHTAKDDKTEHPFGSVFFSNLARATYWVRKAVDQESDDILAALVNRKTNDGKLKQDFGVHVHFDGDNGPVQISGINAVRNVPGSDEDRPLWVRAHDKLLLIGKAPLYMLADELGIDRGNRAEMDNLRKALSRGQEKRKFGTATEGNLQLWWALDATGTDGRSAPSRERQSSSEDDALPF